MIFPESLPLISIVIGTFNGERYLAEQLETIVHQTYPNLEIIIVDDNSTDKTPQIIQDYKNKYSQLRTFFNEENLGYVKNFEKGASLSGGEFICFCDQDDIWDLEKTEILYNEIGDKPLIFCDDLMVDENLNSLGKRQSDLVNSMSVGSGLYFVLDNVVGGHALMITRKVLNIALPFPKVIPHDLWCAYIAAYHGGVKYLDRVLVKWRQHSKAVTKYAKDNSLRISETRQRLAFFYQFCPEDYPQDKKVLLSLISAYQGFSPKNNFNRMILFFRYHKYLLGFKKRSPFRKFLFCLKMFYKLRLHVA